MKYRSFLYVVDQPEDEKSNPYEGRLDNAPDYYKKSEREGR